MHQKRAGTFQFKYLFGGKGGMGRCTEPHTGECDLAQIYHSQRPCAESPVLIDRWIYLFKSGNKAHKHTHTRHIQKVRTVGT